MSNIPHLGDIEQLDSLGLRQIKYLMFDNHHLAVHHKTGSRVEAGQVYPATEYAAGPGSESYRLRTKPGLVKRGRP